MERRLRVYKSDHNNQGTIINRWAKPFDQHVLHGDARKGDQPVHTKGGKLIMRELKWMLLKYAESVGLKSHGSWRVIKDSYTPTYQMFAMFTREYCDYAGCYYTGHIPSHFFDHTSSSFQIALKSGVTADFNSYKSKETAINVIHAAMAVSAALLDCMWIFNDKHSREVV